MSEFPNLCGVKFMSKDRIYPAVLVSSCRKCPAKKTEMNDYMIHFHMCTETNKEIDKKMFFTGEIPDFCPLQESGV